MILDQLRSGSDDFFARASSSQIERKFPVVVQQALSLPHAIHESMDFQQITPNTSITFLKLAAFDGGSKVVAR